MAKTRRHWLLNVLIILAVLCSILAFVVHSRNWTRLQEDRIRSSQRREALRGDLLKRVVGAQEAERQRIARELHDETGQALTAVGLGLQGLQAKFPDGEPRIKSNLRSLQELVTHSMSELQRIIGDLRPSHLDDLGLRAALRWYAGVVSERSQLEIVMETHLEKLLGRTSGHTMPELQGPVDSEFWSKNHGPLIALSTGRQSREALYEGLVEKLRLMEEG